MIHLCGWGSNHCIYFYACIWFVIVYKYYIRGPALEMSHLRLCFPNVAIMHTSWYEHTQYIKYSTKRHKSDLQYDACKLWCTETNCRSIQESRCAGIPTGKPASLQSSGPKKPDLFMGLGRGLYLNIRLARDAVLIMISFLRKLLYCIRIAFLNLSSTRASVSRNEDVIFN